MNQQSTLWSGPNRSTYALWVMVCALAELIGIAIGAVWWASVDRLDPEPITTSAKWMALLFKSTSGIGEGLILGTLQALMLRRIYPALSIGRWVLYTTLLAVAGWAAGSAIPLFGEFSSETSEPFDPPLIPLALASSALGALLGLLFGLVQREALKTAARNTRWWVFANAIGWGLALPIIYVAASIGNPDAPVQELVMTGLLAGLCAGVVLGASTGFSFRRMEPIN